MFGMLPGIEIFTKQNERTGSNYLSSLPVCLEIYPADKACSHGHPLPTPPMNPLLHFSGQSYWTLNVIYYLSSFLTRTKYNEQLGISLRYGNGMQSGTMEKCSLSLPNLRMTETQRVSWTLASLQAVNLTISTTCWGCFTVSYLFVLLKVSIHMDNHLHLQLKITKILHYSLP